MFPFAQMAPPNATGAVQFRDGDRNLDGPRQVIAGIAIGQLTFLGGGSHSITAVFTPANPAAFQPSTSNTVTFTF